MQAKDLEAFNEMPFFFWVKDEEGRYIWVNHALNEKAGVDLTGKTDNVISRTNGITVSEGRLPLRSPVNACRSDPPPFAHPTAEK